MSTNHSTPSNGDDKEIPESVYARHIARTMETGHFFLFSCYYAKILPLTTAVFLQHIMNLSSMKDTKRTESRGKTYFQCSTGFLENSMLGWTEEQQRYHLGILLNKQFIHQVKLGMPAKRWIRVDLKRIHEAIDEWEENSSTGKNPCTGKNPGTCTGKNVTRRIDKTSSYPEKTKKEGVSADASTPSLPGKPCSNGEHHQEKSSSKKTKNPQSKDKEDSKKDKHSSSTTKRFSPAIKSKAKKDPLPICLKWSREIRQILHSQIPPVFVDGSTRGGAIVLEGLLKSLKGDEERVQELIDWLGENINEVKKPKIGSVNQFCKHFNWLEDQKNEEEGIDAKEREPID